MKSEIRRFAGAVVATLVMLAGASFAGETESYWVFFRDKGIPAGQEEILLDRAQTNLTERARVRRVKNGAPLADYYDIALHPDYVLQVRATGAKIRCGSKWLNAVSVEATEAQLRTLRGFTFVQKVEPFRGQRAMLDAPRLETRCSQSLDDPNYGLSFTQNQLCRVPELHARGLTGRGVLVCILDTGFETRHESLDSMNVLARYDFIFGDTIVTNEPGQDSSQQFLHGTACLSALGGYQDGVLVGPAFDADFLLAKTEWVADETPIEEDYYVAGLEWADSLGADITSSSLGYIDWYTFQDMDGRTAVTTIAVNIAMRHGILVCTAGGNERGSWWNHIIAPADADSILAVGAVDSFRQIAGFSSPGPTADGRIKPDVCAMGVDVMCADAWDFDHYWFWGGTSLATPIVAGVAALVMEAHPDWTAQQVRTAMMQTASRHQNPNNDYGWGIVNGVAAVDFVFENAVESRVSSPRSMLILSSYPNPVNGFAQVTLTLPRAGAGRLRVYDVSGRLKQMWATTHWAAGSHQMSVNLSNYSSGVYLLRFEGEAGSASGRMMLVK